MKFDFSKPEPGKKPGWKKILIAGLISALLVQTVAIGAMASDGEDGDNVYGEEVYFGEASGDSSGDSTGDAPEDTVKECEGLDCWNHCRGEARNVVPATCTEDGSQDFVFYCTVCGKVLRSTPEVLKATGHTPAAAVEENTKAATCGKAGSYDSVVYCSVCNKEISRTKETIPATGKHTASAAVKENVVKATGAKTGSYDSVVYCSVCKQEMSRTSKTIPKAVLTISETIKTYTGKAIKPDFILRTTTNKVLTNYTVKYYNNTNVGIAKIKVILGGSNYEGTITKTFTIKPVKTAISSLTALSQGFTVKWNKKTAQTTGYQIQFADNSSFKNPVSKTVKSNTTTSKSFYGLTAKKTYYVRVRTYMKASDGVTYYSSWSSSKSVKTKA